MGRMTDAALGLNSHPWMDTSSLAVRSMGGSLYRKVGVAAALILAACGFGVWALRGWVVARRHAATAQRYEGSLKEIEELLKAIAK